MFDIDLDVLYWRAIAGGFSYAMERFSLDSPHFDWDLGIRLDLSYQLPRDDWDLSLICSHLHTKAHGETLQPHHPLWTPPFFWDCGCTSEADARWRLHFAQFDLILGKHWNAGRYWNVHPFLGTRIACMRQKFRVYYDKDRLSTKNKFLGGGILMGVDASWAILQEFYLFTEGALGLLYGNIYIHESEKTGCGFKQLSMRSGMQVPVPVIDLSLGCCWSKRGWDVHLGWEEHLFFKQTQLIRFVDSKIPAAYVSLSEDLALQGLILGIKKKF